MFLASHICWVSSGTDSARYCWLPRLVRGVKPTMKKCRRGKGIRLTASLRRSEFSWPAHHGGQHVSARSVSTLTVEKVEKALCSDRRATADAEMDVLQEQSLQHAQHGECCCLACNPAADH